MILGFEEETFELTDYETNVLTPVFVEILENRKGKKHSITSTRIIEIFKARDIKIDQARIRKIIHHIRVKALVKNLMATSKGYYIAENEAEMRIYIESLRQREDSIREIRKSLLNQIQYL